MKALGPLAIGAALSLAGCASDGTPNSQSQNSAGAARLSVPMSARTEAPDLGALKTYGIPESRCGMILYTLASATPVPIFRSTDDGVALLEIEGHLTELTLVGRGGETRMSIPSIQYFQGMMVNGMQVAVAATTTWGKTFPGGAYVQEGTMTVTAADGWSRVVPVAGIAGCKA